MFCPKCGNQLKQNQLYCDKCGNYVNDNNLGIQYNDNNPLINEVSNVAHIPNTFDNFQSTNSNNISKDNKKMIFIGIAIGILFLLFVFIISLLIKNKKGDYYFSNNSYENTEEIIQDSSTKNSSKKGSKYSTVIIADNTYSGVKINTSQDAYYLISDDSISQKSNCPTEIKEIEDEIIKKYGITAVNLCEMDIGFAKEIANVFEKIYKEYPSVRGYLTNLTLVNASLSDGYIAAFMPAFNFATSDSSSTYPWVIKTQVLLNTTYFLNMTRLDASVRDGSNSGHFPPNATMYSPVAHELGHYLSFLAMMKSYGVDSILLIDNNNIETYYDIYSDFGKGNFSLLMITEAYENYTKEVGTTLTIDEWRATISNYAIAKNNSGNYIYDETIAEAFHDVYLNGEAAKDASKYIVAVLKNKLEGNGEV